VVVVAAWPALGCVYTVSLYFLSSSYVLLFSGVDPLVDAKRLATEAPRCTDKYGKTTRSVRDHRRAVSEKTCSSSGLSAS
jgi:hypothetical protein